jgi:thiamine-phosphate diphosphorylase
MPLIDVPTVHAVTDRRILGDPAFPGRAAAVMKACGPAVAIHLRGGSAFPDRTLLELGIALVRTASGTGSLIVVNGRPDVARAAGVPAVQLTRWSVAATDARRIAPGCRVGVSVHSVDDARAACNDRADWIIAGHIFETPTHAGVPPKGVEFVSELAAIGLPVIAIGGITPQHVPAVMGAGAHGIAAIRGIWDSPDPSVAAASYLRAL